MTLPRRLLAAVLTACWVAPAAAVARPDHVVLGYVPFWRDAIADPADIDFDAFTHLARAFLRPRPDGTLTVDSGYFDPAFESAAHAHGVKLLMSIGGQSETPDVWLALARNPAHVAKFLDTLAGLYAAHPAYDGADVDWEPSPANDADGRTYAALLHAIRTRFPGKLLTVAIPSKDYAVAHLPIAAVVADLDLIGVMAYDYAGPWTGQATFGANLHPDPAPPARTPFSVDQGMANLINHRHFPPQKLLLGMTFWGYRFRAAGLGGTFPAHGTGFADFVEYPRVLDLIDTGRFAAARDDTADAADLTRTGGGAVVTYDDPAAIRDKCKTAVRLGCGGVMIWHVGADLAGGRTPLLDVVDESFGVPVPPASVAALRAEVARLRGKPVGDDETTESLEAADRQLRLARAKADDDRWQVTPTQLPAARPAKH